MPTGACTMPLKCSSTSRPDLLARRLPSKRPVRVRCCHESRPATRTPSTQDRFPDNPLDRPEPGEPGIRLPNQARTLVKGEERRGVTVLEKDKGGADIDYLQVCKSVKLLDLEAGLVNLQL
jgi:hypothetical protein